MRHRTVALLATLCLTAAVLVHGRRTASRMISETVTGNAVVITSWQIANMDISNGNNGNGHGNGNGNGNDDDNSRRKDKHDDKPGPGPGGPGPATGAPLPKPNPPNGGGWCQGPCVPPSNNNNNNNGTDPNPDNNSNLSTLRIVLLVQQNEIYISYRYFSFLYDPDQQSLSDDDFKYMLRLGKLVEYAELNGNNGYQASGDHVVQTWNFASADPFTDWQASADSNGVHSYKISNGIFTFVAHVSAAAFQFDGQQLYPDELKFDVEINNFPYQVKTQSYLALVGWLQSDMDMQASSDNNRISMNGADAYLSWVPTCQASQGSCSIALGAVYDDPDNVKDDDYDNEKAGKNDKCKATIWSFITDGSQLNQIVWDPTVGSNYAGDTTVDTSASNDGGKTYAAALAMTTVLAALLSGLIA